MGKSTRSRSPCTRTTGVILACVFAVSGGLYGCLTALSECPPDIRTLANGEKVNGVSPDQAMAPLLGDHVGTLTWSVPGRTTPVHLDVERTSPSDAEYDCEGKFDAFDVSVTAHLFTEDGLVNATASGLTVDPDGHVQDPSWSWRPMDASIQDAGVVPGSPLGTEVHVSASIVDLVPVGGTVVVSWIDAVPSSGVTIGTIRFSP
jgi:hypothetical protein